MSKNLFKLSNKTTDLVMDRLEYLSDLRDGNIRTRSNGWHNRITLYDLNRIVDFLDRLNKDEEVNVIRFDLLRANINEFEAVVSTKLVYSITNDVKTQAVAKAKAKEVVVPIVTPMSPTHPDYCAACGGRCTYFQ